jgi:hypothetical protein
MVTSHGFCGAKTRGLPSGVEASEARSEHHEDAEGEAAGDAVDDAGRVGVVVAEQLDHPAFRMPAPGRVDDPEHRPDQDREDPERAGADALDDRAGNDRCRRPREQQERRPEHAGDAVAKVGAHGVGPRRVRRAGLEIDPAGDPRTVRESEIDPPAEEEERDGDQRDQHRVLHQGVEVVAPAAGADLVHAETDVDQEHDDDGHPVVELGEYRR